MRLYVAPSLEQDAFKDETGNFNRTLLNQVLSSNGVTEQGVH